MLPHLSHTNNSITLATLWFYQLNTPGSFLIDVRKHSFESRVWSELEVGDKVLQRHCRYLAMPKLDDYPPHYIYRGFT